MLDLFLFPHATILGLVDVETLTEQVIYRYILITT